MCQNLSIIHVGIMLQPETTHFFSIRHFQLTLIIPYEEIDAESALVEMFAQRGAWKSKYIVAIGALAGLTVSMFGSMFPMPRIVYAMAKDGLIFR